jgi:hypothetical protein
MRPTILVAALLWTIGAAGQALAESCNDIVIRERDIKSEFESGAISQQAALAELRNLQLQANMCDPGSLNAIDQTIQRVSGPPQGGGPSYSPPEDTSQPENPQTWSPPEDRSSDPETPPNYAPPED